MIVTPTLRSSLRSTTDKPMKSVTFSVNCEYRSADDRHHFHEDEMEKMWFTKVELKNIKKHLKRILTDLSLLDDDDDVYRGLEVFANNNRKNRTFNHVIPVLKRHWKNMDMEMEDDSEELRALSVSLNQVTTAEAIQRAAQDAMEAYEVHSEENESVVVRKTFEKTTFKVCAPVAPFRRQRSTNAARSA